MQTLINVTDRSALTAGITPGLLPADAGLWHDGENVVFKRSGVQSMPSWMRLFRPDDGRVYAIAQAYIGKEKEPRLYVGTSSKLYAWQETLGAVEIGSGYSGHEWSFAIWGNWLLATNGVDPVVSWRGNFANPAVQLVPGRDWAKLIRRVNAHVVLLNTSYDGSELLWCSDDDIDEWDLTDTTKTAGELMVRDLDSEIVAAEMLGDVLAIYSGDGMALLSYYGAPTIFGVQKALDDIGAVGMNAVAVVGRQHYGMSRRGIWVTDGTQMQYVDDPAVKQFLQDDVNWDEASKVVALHDELETMVVFYYPSEDGITNDAGVGFNYTTGAWTRFDVGMSAAGSRIVMPYPLIADDLGVFELGHGDRAGIYPKECWVQTKPLDLNDPSIFKRVQALFFSFESVPEGLYVRLGAQNSLEEEVEWFHFSEAARDLFILDREVVYLTIRLESSNCDWALGQFRVHGLPTGAVAC